MSSTDQHEEFVERAHENRLKISRSHAEEIGSFSESVTAAYSTIREIDTTGFEPAAIFVPTPSERESE
jgi:hypothetical protein